MASHHRGCESTAINLKKQDNSVVEIITEVVPCGCFICFLVNNSKCIKNLAGKVIINQENQQKTRMNSSVNRD